MFETWLYLRWSWVIGPLALDDEAMRERAIRAGCVAFLRKPFQAHQLVDAIKKAVS